MRRVRLQTCPRSVGVFIIFHYISTLWVCHQEQNIIDYIIIRSDIIS